MATTPRVRAPELRGRGWLNTGGRNLTLADLRGRIVILDFWTFCCINCLHVLDELRPVEERYRDVLVIVGVHSPKFEHERDPDALVAAVERYGVAHPVLDDPELITWQRYAAKAWPTLSLVDPTGYLVASMAGEGHAEGLTRLIDELVEIHTAQGTLRRGDGPYVPAGQRRAGLCFPGKAVISEGRLWATDSANHRVVELSPDGTGIRRTIGSGIRGRADGPATEASFSEPQGLCALPSTVADRVGYQLVVADTVNHLLRGVSAHTGDVTTVAGTGRQGRGDGAQSGGAPSGDAEPNGDQPLAALAVDLSSPWDVAWYDDRVVVAMAGTHQLWWFDPLQGTAGVYAGTTVEALRDGPLPDVWLAQPSGLSVSADQSTLWVVDSETSALRHIRDGVLRTAIGQGLFDFGHVDGPAATALLQHPLGVCALPDGSVLVADTYNGAIRRFDPGSGMVSTIEDGLSEPSDIVPTDDGGALVVESAAHRLVRLTPDTVTGTAATTVREGRHRTERPPTELAPGPITVEVIFTPAPGQKLDDTYGTPTRLEISASPPELLLAGAGLTTELSREVIINGEVAAGVLQVVAQAATCDSDAEHAACHLTRQDWGVPVRIAATGTARLPLVLRGLDD